MIPDDGFIVVVSASSCGVENGDNICRVFTLARILPAGHEDLAPAAANDLVLNLLPMKLAELNCLYGKTISVATVVVYSADSCPQYIRDIYTSSVPDVFLEAFAEGIPDFTDDDE